MSDMSFIYPTSAIKFYTAPWANQQESNLVTFVSPSAIYSTSTLRKAEFEKLTVRTDQYIMTNRGELALFRGSFNATHISQYNYIGFEANKCIDTTVRVWAFITSVTQDESYVYVKYKIDMHQTFPPNYALERYARKESGNVFNIEPRYTKIQAGSTVQMKAEYRATNYSSNLFTYRVTSGGAGVNITDNGLLTIASTVAVDTSIIVVATEKISSDTVSCQLVVYNPSA